LPGGNRGADIDRRLNRLTHERQEIWLAWVSSPDPVYCTMMNNGALDRFCIQSALKAESGSMILKKTV